MAKKSASKPKPQRDPNRPFEYTSITGRQGSFTVGENCTAIIENRVPDGPTNYKVTLDDGKEVIVTDAHSLIPAAEV